MDSDHSASVYQAIAGGPELLRWFDGVPRFQDAEIISISLNRAGPSFLVLHGWKIAKGVGPDGFFVVEKSAVVTFALEDITDLQLDGFAQQNVIDELCLNRVSTDCAISAGDPLAKSPETFELLLEHCFGLSGYLRARRVSVSFEAFPSESSL
jgi:hypothetical protein